MKLVTIAILVAALGCGPNTDLTNYRSSPPNEWTAFSLEILLLKCREQVARSAAWLPDDRQVIFDACLFEARIASAEMLRRGGFSDEQLESRRIVTIRE